MEDLSFKSMDIGVAIMGYGVVGKGVAYAIRNNCDQIEKRTGLRLRLLHILDILNFPDSPDAALITHEVQDIMNDVNVDVVVETMGGIKIAHEYTRDALARRKHVVTSNKELVAEYGPELLALARSCGVHYRFDASVGGGIPIVSTIRECLAANRVEEIIGILNGTTNYMLTYMRDHGACFAETLKMAQDEGYAEKDPSADIGGADACRKLAILSSIALDAFIDWKDIHTEGMESVTVDDVALAADLGRVLKLVARARRLEDGRVEAYVLPAMLDRHSLLSGVDGVNNAVMVRGDLTGDVMLYGQGAGALPTGSAIISDIVKSVVGQGAANGQEASNGQGKANCQGAIGDILYNPYWDRKQSIDVIDFSACSHSFYVRAESSDMNAFCEHLFIEFPQARILPRAQAGDPDMSGAAANECAFTAPCQKEGDFSNKLACIISKISGSSIKFIARLI